VEPSLHYHSLDQLACLRVVREGSVWTLVFPLCILQSVDYLTSFLVPCIIYYCWTPEYSLVQTLLSVFLDAHAPRPPLRTPYDARSDGREPPQAGTLVAPPTLLSLRPIA